jgi:hypothetical protein
LENRENIEHRIAKRTTHIGEYHESQTRNHHFADIGIMVTAIDLLIILHLLDMEILIATNTPEQVPKSWGNYIPAGHLFSNTPGQVPKHPEAEVHHTATNVTALPAYG